jgi:hypothetical protein
MRAADAAAAGPSALCWDWQTAFPCNVNESDLDPAMQSLPPEHDMPTDMIFCLVRYEIADFIRRTWLDVQNRAPDFSGSEFGHPLIPLAEKLRAIEGFEQKLQVRYLYRCDSHIALHIMTKYYATYAISKMRIAAYATSAQPSPENDQTIPTQRREKIMHVCLDAIEAYTGCCTNRELEKFAWFLHSSVPFLAYVHLLFHLRYRPSGSLADRAWKTVTTETDVHGRPRWIWGPSPSGDSEPEDSAMQLAFANLTVKAWEVRESTFETDQDFTVPILITNMREKLKRHQRQRTGWTDASDLSDEKSQHQQADSAYFTLPSKETLPQNTFELQLPMQDMPMDSEFAIFDYWNTLLPGNSFAD